MDLHLTHVNGPRILVEGSAPRRLVLLNVGSEALAVTVDSISADSLPSKQVIYVTANRVSVNKGEGTTGSDLVYAVE